MRYLILFFVIGVLIFASDIQGQTVYTEPALPTANESVTVFFDATDTPLEIYTGIIYTHTGLIKNGISSWQNVIGDWGNNDNQPQLTSLGNNLYQIEINPTIREYYSALESDIIEQMAFVFRSADALTQTEDLFVDVYEPGLNVTIISPDQNPLFVDPDDEISILAEASGALNMHLYIDNELISSVEGNSIAYDLQVDSQIDTKHWIKVTAEDESDLVADSIYYYVRGETQMEDLPEGVEDGINYINENTVTLVLLAPFKNSVYVHGDFNHWQIGPEYKLKRNTSSSADPESRYWVTLSGLDPGEEYGFQYIIDEELFLTDPYTDKILDPANDGEITEETYPDLKTYPYGKTKGIIGILQTGQNEYDWQSQDYEAPKVTDLVVYELLMRDFIHAHDFTTLIDTIGYFKELGINAIELMPVNEFEGNDSWGYNPSFYFAPDKYYGPKNDLKAFIDTCHSNGIAVILDIVLNHAYDQNVLAQMYWDEENSRPSSLNPWFNTESPNQVFQWGNDFDHESQYTKDFIDRVNRYWLKEYKFDGFRFDFTKGFTNTPGDGWAYDSPRIDILKRMADSIWAFNPDAYVILEHLSENSEEKVLADHGMIMWGNMNYNYNEATMGWHDGGKSDFSGVSYQKRNFNDPHLVGYMESHDEERLMAKNINYGNESNGYNIQELDIALQRIELAATFFFTVPGPKMLWQFGELGYDFHINYPGEIGEDDNRLTKKPIRWDYYDDWRRKRVYNVFSSLIDLRKDHPAFETEDFSISASGSMKKIHLNHSSMNVTILGNFDVMTKDINPAFQHNGYWYDYFGGDSIDVTDVNQLITLNAGEYRIYTDVKLDKPEIGLGSTDNILNPAGKPFNVYPNPSYDEFNINFAMDNRDFVHIVIYNMEGQKINTLSGRVFDQGEHIVKWNGKNNQGVYVKPGVYFCEMTVATKKRTQKLVLY